MKSSEQLDQLFTAFAKAQADFGIAVKDSTNPHFNSRFASLREMIKVSRPALTANGLSVSQPPVRIDENGKGILQTILGHSSGQWILSEIELKPRKKGALSHEEDEGCQAYGSCITFMRRYAYGSTIGLAIDDDEDDDGEAAEGRGNSTKKNEPPKENDPNFVNTASLISLYDKLTDMGLDLSSTLKKYGKPYEEIKFIAQPKKQEFMAELVKIEKAIG